MKRSLTIVLAAGFLLVAQAQIETPHPSADQLLAQVVSRLPREPLTVTGNLVVRRHRGVVIEELTFEMMLNWGSLPSVARYTIRDAFGSDLERLTVRRGADSRPRFSYAKGNPLAPAEVPPLSDAIRSSDLTWMDLALSFLWWEGGAVTRMDEIRGRRCFVVEVPAPPDAPPEEQGAGASGGAKSRAGARLWIDEEMRMLLRAECLDAAGQPVRTLWVKSFKKIDDRWMIKDMEVESSPAEHRTKLTVREVGAGTSL